MGEYSKRTIERRNRCFAVGLPLFVLAVIMLMAAVNVRASDTRTVTGTKNYLALRSSAKYNDKNVIGKLYNGEQVIITGGWDGDYVWVYAPSLDKSGFVNGKYLSKGGSSSGSKKSESSSSGDTRTVTGTKNYLALRSSAKYSDKNVIGKLYNGEQVIITGGWDGDYVWVYAPSLDKSGFVNGKYLSKGGSSSGSKKSESSSSGDTRTVTGTKNYLALRSSAKYSDKNVIGKLYNGDQVIITGGWDGDYVWVYAPTLDKSGFVNGKYLSGGGSSSGSKKSKSSSGDTRTVTGTKNYLALRSSAKYSDKNVIGKLYNGDQVIITGGWDGDYVWVYAPSLDKSGFVNGKYLK